MSGAAGWAVRLLVNGVEPLGTPVLRFAVRASRYACCDTAEIDLAVDRSALGGSDVWFDGRTVARIDLQLQVRRGDDAWTTLFHGLADEVEWQPEAYRATLLCRDYLSLLLDARVQEAWLNRTGAELVSALVEGVGLRADIAFGDGASGMTGQFWQIEHKRFSALAQHRFQTAFDLAFFVAREANADLYADGQTIVGRPVFLATDVDAVVHDVARAMLARTCRRDLTMDNGVVVHVASWDSRQRSRTEIYYDGRDFSTVAPSGSGPVHHFRVPGRRLDDVKAIALGKYHRIAAHRGDIWLRIPGRVALRPRHFLASGSGGAGWPAALSVDEVISSGSVTGGFVQEVVLRDRSVGRAA